MKREGGYWPPFLFALVRKDAVVTTKMSVFYEQVTGVKIRSLASANTQSSFADAVNVAAFLRTNSRTLSGACPVSVSTSSDILS